MNKVKLTGYGYALPDQIVRFGVQTRYRLKQPADFWLLVEQAAASALERAGVSIGEVDCIVAAMATPLQPIPCNAALVHERLTKGMDIPAFDINSSCTSFITALELMSYLIDAGKYNRVLLVSGDVASAALNPNETESYELFSDVCTAFVLETTDESYGILFARQKTWSEGAHQTEIPCGGSLSSAFQMHEENHDNYYFTMKGRQVVRLTLERLSPFIKECLSACGKTIGEFQLVVPHQASRVLSSLMKRIGFTENQYIDLVQEYGNMVSGSVPFALCRCIESGRLQRGQEVLLLGTAAGLTMNFLILRY